MHKILTSTPLIAKGQLADPWSPGKWPLNGACACVKG